MKAANRAAPNPGAPNGHRLAATPRRLISLAEAADTLAVSTKTVRRYIAAGELDAVRLGRRTIRVRVDSLDRLIDGHPLNTWGGRSA